MNYELWSSHLSARVTELEAELKRARWQRNHYRERAAYWSAQAIDAATELRRARCAPDLSVLRAVDQLKRGRSTAFSADHQPTP